MSTFTVVVIFSYLLDGMQWCGMKKNSGVNYNFCPYECAKQKAFWVGAAEKVKRLNQTMTKYSQVVELC